ncbi:ATP-dependent Clp protease ATP-binding subunit ClpX [Acrasis kona]|uniref:ATP-dependent Clp protease ATP-binding subunit ClpX n=1 Tax=Acrasis kona TaxID=1008807 RepID=A0AAW2YY26_9EUKA
MLRLYLGFQPLTDRIGPVLERIEMKIWGDARARHAYLVAIDENEEMTLIEIKMTPRKNLILVFKKIECFKMNTLQLEYLGATVLNIGSLKSLSNMFIERHRRYSFHSTNCRMFVEYIIDNIPELSCLEKRNGSILEHFHYKAKKSILRCDMEDVQLLSRHDSFEMTRKIK